MIVKEPSHAQHRQNLSKSLPKDTDIGVIIRKYAKGKYYLWLYVPDNGLIMPLSPRELASVTGCPRNSNNDAIIVHYDKVNDNNFIVASFIRDLAFYLHGNINLLTFSILNSSG